MAKKIAVFGSTGSVGTATLAVARQHSAQVSVVALAAGRKLDLLLEQVQEFRPAVAIITYPTSLKEVFEAAQRLKRDGIQTELLAGPATLQEYARTADYDVLVGAITGAAGLPANIEAARRGKRLAIANKESLVVAGGLLTALAAESGAELLPVDSEHSAVWQCLRGEQHREVRRVILTASGGPFRRHTMEQLEQVTVQQALKHPTWEMGPKITVDSSTLFNKALEVIEARWLFGLTADQLDVVVHPQSVIHSMVEFNDLSVMAQLGIPDMRIPIQLALSAPERWTSEVAPMDFRRALSLEFEPLDHDRFPAVRLGFEVCREGGTAGAVFNAANEVAVERFLAGEIGWLGIYRTVADTLSAHQLGAGRELHELLEADAWARSFARGVG